MKISAKYDWLKKMQGLPKMVQEAIKLGALNTTEYPGAKDNPEIIALAIEADVKKIYTNDEIPWCALAHTVIALRAGKDVDFTGYDRLRAKSFANWGKQVLIPMLGDTLVFGRAGGYHVGIYIGEDDTCFHVAGGNQSNQYNITRIEKKRMIAARRPEYSIGLPATVKRIILSGTGEISKNEA